MVPHGEVNVHIISMLQMRKQAPRGQNTCLRSHRQEASEPELMCLIPWSEYKTTKPHLLPLTIPLSLGTGGMALMRGSVERCVCGWFLARTWDRGVHCPHVDALGPPKRNFTFRRKTRNLMT